MNKSHSPITGSFNSAAKLISATAIVLLIVVNFALSQSSFQLEQQKKAALALYEGTWKISYNDQHRSVRVYTITKEGYVKWNRDGKDQRGRLVLEANGTTYLLEFPSGIVERIHKIEANTFKLDHYPTKEKFKLGVPNNDAKAEKVSK
ncbi:MAG: hypothetical protein ABMA13_05520 [Chthoniobacteraceae bacterium]